MLDMPASTVRSIRNKNGVFVGKKKFKPSIEEFISVYDELQSSVKVGDYYGVGHHTVIKFAKDIGYDTKYRREVTAKEREYIINNYDKKTSTHLSKELGIKPATICAIWRKAALKGKQKRVYIINENVLDKIDTEEKAYFLGFFAADGCVSKNKAKQDTITFTISKEDWYILDKFYKMFESNKNVYIQNKYASFEISSNYICNKIYELGFSPRKTYSNTFCLLDDNLMPHFIRGYFDGDGNVSGNNIAHKASVSIAGYEDNMDKIIKYLNEKHIHSIFCYDKRKKYTNTDKKFGALTLTNKLNKYCFLKYIYEDATIYLARKKEKADEFIQIIENTDRITHLDIVDYYKYAVQKVC